MKDNIKIKGLYKLWKNTKEGERIFIGEFPNVITKAFKDAVLNTVGQVSGGGTEIGPSFYIHYIALGREVVPRVEDWWNLDLDAICSELAYQIIATPPVAVTPDATGVVVLFETTYMATIDMTINVLAAINATGVVSASNLISVCALNDIILNPGDSVDIAYQLSFIY